MFEECGAGKVVGHKIRGGVEWGGVGCGGVEWDEAGELPGGERWRSFTAYVHRCCTLKHLLTCLLCVRGRSETCSPRPVRMLPASSSLMRLMLWVAQEASQEALGGMTSGRTHSTNCLWKWMVSYIEWCFMNKPSCYTSFFYLCVCFLLSSDLQGSIPRQTWWCWQAPIGRMC